MRSEMLAGQLSTRSDAHDYGSYTNWLQVKQPDLLSVQHGWQSDSASVSHIVAEEAFSDPPTPDVVVIQMKSGTCELSRVDVGFGTFSYAPQAGESIVMPAGVPTTFEGHGRFEILTLAIPWIAIGRDLELLAGREVSHFDATHRAFRRDPYLELLVDAVWKEQELRVESELYVESIVAMITNRLLMASEPNIRFDSSNRIRLGRQELKDVLECLHHVESTSLDELAEIANCSRFHFCRAFSHAMGLSPNQYLQRVRVERARVLISRGKTLTLAALEAGFADQPHMTRYFKRIYGITPGAYRRECER